MANRLALRWIQFGFLWGGVLFIAFTLLQNLTNLVIVDLAVMGLFTLIALYNFRDKNLLGVLLVLILSDCANNLIWHVYLSNIYAEFALTSLCILCCGRFWYDLWAKIMAATGVACLASQVYFYYIDYPDVVQLSWYLAVGTLHIVKRHYILYRTSWSRGWSNQIYFINLDWQVYDITKVISILCILTIIEYLVRHIMKFQSMIIYNSYSIVHHILNLCLFYFIYQHIKQDKSKFSA